MSGTNDGETVLATVSTGAGTTQQSVELTSATPISGTYVATSPAGTIGYNPLFVYNWDPATQLTSLLAALASGTGASIATVGDSTTLGFGSAVSSFRELSYPAELAQALTQDGVVAQSDGFFGQGNENGDVTDNRVSLIGGAAWTGIYDAGGQVIETTAAGEGFDFTINTPSDYNQVTVSYIDLGSGSVTLSVNGTTVGSLNFGNTGNTLSQTINIPTGLYSEVTVTANNSNPVYIQGVSFSNSTSNAIQVLNTAIGGWGTGNANLSYYNGQYLEGSALGFGQIAGTFALNPNLTLVDLGINDMTGFANGGVTVPTATIVANLTQIITTLRAAGSDVILVIPQPFSDPSYATQLPALRAALQNLSLAENVPLIDLSATYDNNFAALAAAGLMSDNLHPDATLYADIGSQIGAVLANAITGANSAIASTYTGTSGNDTLGGGAANNTLVGNGGNDTYVVSGGNQLDAIINDTAASPSPSGQLDISSISHDRLWFSQSGENLAISVLGAATQVVIQNWFTGAGGQALQSIVASDGTLTYSTVQTLVSAMSEFSSANSGFDPSVSAYTSLTDGYFAGSLATAVTAAWSTSSNPPCFCIGTRILTPAGPVAVETLRPGDRVSTLHAGIQTIRWIGQRAYRGPLLRDNYEMLPICIKIGAIADNVPSRDLFVSPGHGIAIDGAIVHAASLINGVSIIQVAQVEKVEYFHIELFEHEILLAENSPVESYLDNGSRLQFQNGAACTFLDANKSNRPTSCLPLLEDGFVLAAIHRRLAARAGITLQEGVGTLYGFVDIAVPPLCAGWAQDEAQPEVPVCLDILMNGRRVTRVLANRYRADLRAAGFGSGNHGFLANLPLPVTGKIEVRRASDLAPLAFTEVACDHAA